ncbi:MAG: aspartate kinase [Waddliaceae bacterium]|nr:aspartate kinase [Waddliaceae bacterium]
MRRCLVMKFGGAAVANTGQFSQIASIIRQKRAIYEHIVVVVSAMGDSTDQLVALAHEVHPQPPKREYDMLISVGERVSIALLAMALELQGLDAVSFTGSQSGVVTSTNHGEACIVAMRPHRVQRALDQGKVVIVAGFQGCSSDGEITTLGRGGSDTSAVALGVALDAEKIEFYKDVEGVYSSDPKKDSSSVLFEELTYEQALDLASAGTFVLHPRCVVLAQKNAMPLQVRSFHCLTHSGTMICSSEQRERGQYFYEEGPLFSSSGEIL